MSITEEDHDSLQESVLSNNESALYSESHHESTRASFTNRTLRAPHVALPGCSALSVVARERGDMLRTVRNAPLSSHTAEFRNLSRVQEAESSYTRVDDSTWAETFARELRNNAMWQPMRFRVHPNASGLKASDVLGKHAPIPVCDAVLESFHFEKVVVLFGGTTKSKSAADSDRSINTTWIYEIEHHQWLKCADLSPEMDQDGNLVQHVPDARSGACSCKLLHYDAFAVSSPLHKEDVRDGLCPQSNQHNLEEDLRSNAITSVPNVPTRTHSYSPLVWVFGGACVHTQHNTLFYQDIWTFDVRSRRWHRLSPVGKPPTPRWHAACASVELNVYVFGGESSAYSVLGDLHMFNYETGTWSEITQRVIWPSPRTLHACTTVRDMIILTGGMSSEKPLSDTWILDTRSEAWICLSTDPASMHSKPGSPSSPFHHPATEVCVGLYGHTMSSLEHMVLVFGGKMGHGACSNALWALNILDVHDHLCKNGTTTQEDSSSQVPLSWERLSVRRRGGVPTGTDHQHHGTPEPRWRHSASALEVSCFVRTCDFLAPILQNLRQNPAPGELLRAGNAKEEIKKLREVVQKQLRFQGLQISYFDKLVLVRGLAMVSFGGTGNTRGFGDLWMYHVSTEGAQSLCAHRGSEHG